MIYALRITSLLLLLTACTGLSVRSRDTNASPASSLSSIMDSDVDAMLRYHQRIKRLNQAELSKEYEQVNQAFGQTKSDLSRVQLSLLLSLPNASFSDDAMALSLLKEWLKDAKPPYAGLRAFGFFLATLLEDMREKDKRADALQKKLDALKSMEKNLMQREKP
jgi:hypothetical protein